MGDTPGIRLLLVDDHELFLAGLRSLLRGEPGLIVVGEAHNGNEALEAARKQPDIILLDLLLETETGPDFLPDLMKAAERARILVLTGVPDPELQLRAVCLGALGIVLKAEAPHILLKAIRKVHAGEAWLNPTMTATAMTRLQARHSGKQDPNAAKIASLTARELEVIAALGDGRRNKEIGERLFISEKTVRHYFTSIYDKLEVTDRLELIIYAYQHGLAKVPSRQANLTPAFKE